VDKRLDTIGKKLADWNEGTRTTDRRTIRHLHGLLMPLRKGSTLETNYPAARLVAEIERAIEAVDAGKVFYGVKSPGQYWLDLTTEKTSCVARVLAPKAISDGKPLPLVVALHGAGGSENLFFDGYGRGICAACCEKEGWLMCAPRSGFTGPPLVEVVDELCRLYPVDRSRIYLVGHSMGAQQAVAAAGKSPDKFAAVAALGGGGTPKPSDALCKLQFFVGIGSEDFLKRNAVGLKKSLESAKVETVVFREYPDIEHVAIVQAAMRDVVEFFKQADRK
jgi:pimeloyl-ACP methyl ester carboxylesterase